MTRPTLIDLNPLELDHYLFIISLDKCIRSCNAVDDKICVQSKTADINVKLFKILKK